MIETQEDKALLKHCLNKDYVSCAKINIRRQLQGRLPDTDLNTQVFFLSHLKPSDVDAQTRRALLQLLELDSLDVSRLTALLGQILVDELNADADNLIEQSLKNDLLKPFLKSMLCSNIALEHLLSKLRHALLMKLGAEGALNHGEIDLASHLLLQLIKNEYLWAVSPIEQELVQGLHQLLLLSSKQPAWEPEKSNLLILMLALYMPLEELWQNYQLYEFSRQQWPNILLPALALTVQAKLHEARLRETIPSYMDSLSAVSAKVQAQYEQHPYPRWQRLRLDKAQTSKAYFNKTLPGARFSFLDNKRVDILVAGCGTGSQPLSLAAQLTNTHVTAIDLSLASLSYGKRMSEKLRIDNVDFAQVDLLDAACLKQDFDFVVCSGVLHHLNDPLQGWQVLTRLLRDGGVMSIALYSAIARAEIRRQRAFVHQAGLSSSASDIKKYRQVLMQREPDSTITQCRDFWSLSECRDLIFHECEHQYSWLGVKEALDKLGLKLLKVEAPEASLAQFDRAFPETGARLKLENWHEFEKTAPSTSIGMYHFWCEKR
ncbi:class I SAM-dependent methyltransferase [Agaribacterium haliotis]|uniref:class I SAM-dependent methyltransferase n=1 Tax=Agaribacterium haliotis TaxID=2013869 RepID=UPI000BB58A89|nr:class I SAM-dependent methyltransferase [Agaribacterium haliotis]